MYEVMQKLTMPFVDIISIAVTSQCCPKFDEAACITNQMQYCNLHYVNIYQIDFVRILTVYFCFKVPYFMYE